MLTFAQEKTVNGIQLPSKTALLERNKRIKSKFPASSTEICHWGKQILLVTVPVLVNNNGLDLCGALFSVETQSTSFTPHSH